mgnify:CR=1 FL=1|jgi:hypothetical protein
MNVRKISLLFLSEWILSIKRIVDRIEVKMDFRPDFRKIKQDLFAITNIVML